MTKPDIWESTLCLGMILALVAMLALHEPAKAPAKNQSQAWHGHTGSGYHAPWIVPLKGTWDQTTRTSIK